MADTLALEKLYDDVTARFTLEGTGATSLFGWRAPSEHVTTFGRVVWVPGKPSGELGRMLPARSPGRNPRSIGTLAEWFHCIVSAHDPYAPEDERAQYKVTRLLYDAWYRAAYLAARGTFQVEDVGWIIDRTQRRWGTALRAVCTVQSMVPDMPLQSVPVDTAAELDASLLDVTEHTRVTAADAP